MLRNTSTGSCTLLDHLPPLLAMLPPTERILEHLSCPSFQCLLLPTERSHSSSALWEGSRVSLQPLPVPPRPAQPRIPPTRQIGQTGLDLEDRRCVSHRISTRGRCYPTSHIGTVRSWEEKRLAHSHAVYKQQSWLKLRPVWVLALCSFVTHWSPPFLSFLCPSLPPSQSCCLSFNFSSGASASSSPGRPFSPSPLRGNLINSYSSSQTQLGYVLQAITLEVSKVSLCPFPGLF